MRNGASLPDMKRLRLAAIPILLIAAVLLYRVVFPSDRTLVERRIHAAGRAMEEERILDLAGCLSRDYQDDAGRTYEVILGFAKSLMNRYSGMKVTFRKMTVSLSGERAKVEMTVHLSGEDSAGGKLSDYLGEQDVRDLTAYLKKGKQGWRIHRVEEGNGTGGP